MSELWRGTVTEMMVISCAFLNIGHQCHGNERPLKNLLTPDATHHGQLIECHGKFRQSLLGERLQLTYLAKILLCQNCRKVLSLKIDGDKRCALHPAAASYGNERPFCSLQMRWPWSCAQTDLFGFEVQNPPPVNPSPLNSPSAFALPLLPSSSYFLLDLSE